VNERYTIAITPNPDAGEDMISILIIDTRPENGKSEIFSTTTHRDQKYTSLHPYLEQIGDDFHLIDLTL